VRSIEGATATPLHTHTLYIADRMCGGEESEWNGW
jgi:hypothetical protein